MEHRNSIFLINKTENHFSPYPRSEGDINLYTRLKIVIAGKACKKLPAYGRKKACNPAGLRPVINRGCHSRCTWTAPTEIEFRCRTMISVSAYLKIDNKKKKKFTEKKSFLPTPKNVTFSAFKLQVAVFLSFLQLCPKLFK
jgi:hypothetical protein